MRVLITGGGHGIGRATAERLLDRGHEVAVLDIEQDHLDDLPGEITTYQGDVYDRERVEEVLDGEELDVLVNCAGHQALGAIEDMAMDDVEQHFETNLFGLLQVTKAALPTLKERDGRIVNVSSLAGKTVAPYWGAYAASKHAVEAVSDALRLELSRFDVDVVVIEPGAIRTGFNEKGARNLERYLPDSAYAENYRRKLASAFTGASPETAAKTLVTAVETDRPSARYTVTWQAWLFPKLKAVLPTWLWDRLVLWHED
ncbi:MAG: SDR family NAD(P)-dependent oxidoreductase [Candidatus Nanohaloarchaea archaeon]|nr:SDR family NAD(P)-dependent oxidoreductase [Candidatus Nanohaloarchaea archaeon]